MLSVKRWCSEVFSKPLELIAGLCVFSTAAAGGAVESIASTSLGILFITCLVYVRSWPQLWRQLTGDERLILLSFGLYVFSAVIAYYNVSDEHEYVKHLGRYLRFLLIIPVYLLLSRADLKLLKYLLAGALVSGPLYFSIALASIAEKPGHPAGGGYHHITFGDMAMLGAMFLTTVLVMMKTSKMMKIALTISILCLLYSSILSTARGAWLALPFCLVVLLTVGIHYEKVRIRTIVIALFVLVAVVVVSPAKDIISSRVQKGVHEAGLFQSGENYGSSVGSRLSMWHIAVNVWKDHPIIGSGPGDFDLDIQTSNEEGKYNKIWVQSSAHSNYFQALATTGTIGFVALCLALVILPFRYFYRAGRGNMNVVALSGMIMITAFSIFGLTESWMLRSPVIAVYLVYFVTLATSASKVSVSDGNRVSNNTS